MDTALNLRDLPKVNEADLSGYQFVSEEIYSRAEDIRVRYTALDKAITLSGSKLIKTLLVVKTDKGFIALDTKIIGMNENGIALEGKTFVPMQAIYSVNMDSVV
jgi:hypothetical protein